MADRVSQKEEGDDIDSLSRRLSLTILPRGRDKNNCFVLVRTRVVVWPRGGGGGEGSGFVPLGEALGPSPNILSYQSIYTLYVNSI